MEGSPVAVPLATYRNWNRRALLLATVFAPRLGCRIGQVRGHTRGRQPDNELLPLRIKRHFFYEFETDTTNSGSVVPCKCSLVPDLECSGALQFLLIIAHRNLRSVQLAHARAVVALATGHCCHCLATLLWCYSAVADERHPFAGLSGR